MVKHTMLKDGIRFKGGISAEGHEVDIIKDHQDGYDRHDCPHGRLLEPASERPNRNEAVWPYAVLATDECDTYAGTTVCLFCVLDAAKKIGALDEYLKMAEKP